MNMETGKIYGAIANILKDIEPVKKERKNTQQNYMFRGVDDAMNALSPLLAKHGVFPATAGVENILFEEVTSKSGSAGYHLIRRYTFRFYAEDGSFIESIADGEAVDYGDKASNKAYSTAYREALWKLFVVPFNNDDTENHDHDLKPKETEHVAPPVKPKIDPYEAAMGALDKCTTMDEMTSLMSKISVSKKLTSEQKEALYATASEMEDKFMNILTENHVESN